jgi:hypothetical protein
LKSVLEVLNTKWNRSAFLSLLYKDAVNYYYHFGAGDMTECGALLELHRWENIEALGKNPAPLLLSPPQDSHDPAG